MHIQDIHHHLAGLAWRKRVVGMSSKHKAGIKQAQIEHTASIQQACSKHKASIKQAQQAYNKHKAIMKQS